MRRKKVAILLLTAIVLAGGVIGIAGCGTTETQQEETEAADQKVAEVCTVTFYDADGTTVLNTVEVENGGLVEEYVPEKDGYTFAGWYATPQMSHKFDFTQAITGDTELFAGFVSYVEDTRSYSIVGSGTSPVLLESNWGKTIGEAQTMTKEDVDGENVYTITLDLEEGDEFQFAIDSSWNDQRGYGYLDTISLDGTDYFQNSGSLGEASTKRSNIKCAVAGNYTFTLTTYPGEDEYETDNANYSEKNKEAFNINPYDVITWTYNGESISSGEEKQVNYYIKGAEITGWEDVYSDETKFVEKDGIYTLTVDLTEGDEFMFTSMVTVGENSSVGTEYIRYTNIAEDDTESLGCVTGTESANLVAKQAGSYTFTYDPATQILTVSFE
ncbi:MAG: InlB B-repeat-containing protein [Lachnospiraceae bacterium]|nr:InlB B-repeat-containing protein [Lachnospiraceae bacterium]